MGVRHKLYLERYLAHMLDGALRVRTEREGMEGITSLGIPCVISVCESVCENLSKIC